MQVVGASDQTIQDIQQKIEEASGDPRSAPVVGGEGGAQWIEMGGQAVNLNIIEEQRWFFFLCLGALGLGKSELGFVEDTNRANGEIEATRVFKRVTGPFAAQFEEAFLHIARQFDAFTQMSDPFQPTLEFTDPREKRAKEERLRQNFQAGVLPLREFLRRTGNQDLAGDDERFIVKVGDTEINYGDHPQWVVQRMMSAAGGTDPEQSPDEPRDYPNIMAGYDMEPPSGDSGNVNRGVRTPEGVPKDANPVSDESECDGQLFEGPKGGLYCLPEDADGVDASGSPASNPFDESPQEVFDDIADGEGVQETVEDLTNRWTGWPTDKATAPMWQATEEQTLNDNAPESISGVSMLEEEADLDEINEYSDYKDNLEDKLREEHGDTITAHRFLHSGAADTLREGGDLEPRTLASWTTEDGNIKDLVDEVPKPNGEFADPNRAVVVTKDIPVENVMDHHAANPELDSAGQDEIIAGSDASNNLSDGEIQTVENLASATGGGG
jgi:hypothetical protein